MKQRRDIFFAIADENRRAILEVLARHGEAMPIGAIAGDFEISRNGIAKHILVLKESGLVRTEFIGRENYVSLEASRLAEVYQWISLFEEFWLVKLDKLKQVIISDRQEQKHKKP